MNGHCKNPENQFLKWPSTVRTRTVLLDREHHFRICIYGGNHVMGKKKGQNRAMGCPNPRRNRRAGDFVRHALSTLGSQDGASATTTASDHPENVMTIQEAEIKISMGIIEHLEGLTLDELIQVLQLILTLEAARGKGKVPDLADLDLEG